MTTLEPILRAHPFFEGLPDSDIALLTGCASNVRFQPGDRIAREGDPAERFFLIREGQVSLEIPAPQGGAIRIQTLDAGEVVGYSWLMPPYRWQFDVTAVTEVRALALNGQCLRGKCDDDPRLGYELMKRFSRIIASRLAGTRLQLLDLYGAKPSAVLSNDD
jgi:CRP/FNR family cyclic AMP-dependent transcriptional regulator